jgi:hypothetical protein
LLGIPLFESNPDVIAQAASRQMFHLQTFQTGPYAEACQQVLGLLAYAQACLLDPQQKAFYDQQLAEALGHRTERLVAAPPPPAGTFQPTGGFAGTMPAAPGAYPEAGAYPGASPAWGAAAGYPVPPAPEPARYGAGFMASPVAAAPAMSAAGPMAGPSYMPGPMPGAMPASMPAAMSPAPLSAGGAAVAVPLSAATMSPMTVPMAAPVAALARPAVAQPAPAGPPVGGGSRPVPPPPPVQPQDEESAYAAVIPDEQIPRKSLRRKLPAKSQGLSKETISLAVAGGVIALLALIWLVSSGLGRQKHGWESLEEPTAASPTKKHPGVEKTEKAPRDSGKKHDDGKFAVRPRPAIGRSPLGVPPVGVRPNRPPAIVEDEGAVIAPPVTTKFPAATHDPFGPDGLGAQGAQPAQPPPAQQAFPPGEDAPPDGAVGMPDKKN